MSVSKEWGDVGEYISVIRASADPASLVALHRWSLNPDEALDLIAMISDEQGLKRPTVAFTSKSGRYYTEDNRLILPKAPLDPARTGNWYGRLRWGIVLHEMGHAIDHHRTPNKRDYHGRRFTGILDELVADYSPIRLRQAAGPAPVLPPPVENPVQERLFDL